MNERFAHLLRLFGSRAAIAKAAGVDKSAVHHWPLPNGLSEERQLDILNAAAVRKMPLDEVAWALDVRRCECCEKPINRKIRLLLNSAGVP